MTIVLDVSFNDPQQQSYDSQNCAISESNRKKSRDKRSACSSSNASAGKVAKIKNKVRIKCFAVSESYICFSFFYQCIKNFLLTFFVRRTAVSGQKVAPIFFTERFPFHYAAENNFPVLERHRSLY